MKRIVLTVIAVVMAGAMMAQTEGLGVHIGFTEPILRLNSPLGNEATKLSNKTVTNGFKLGLSYDASLWKGLGSTLGLNYTFAADRSPWTSASTVGAYPKKQSQTLYQQIELFVDWQYKFEIAKETYLILYSGPSLQCALQFKEQTTTRQFDGSTQLATTDRLANNDPRTISDLNRFNITWGVGAGFQYQRYFLRGGYDFGLMNPYKISNFNEVHLGDRHTRGRLDQWSLKLGIYLWSAGK